MSEEMVNELETLKARADMMGIKYHPATGVDKLRLKIQAKLDGKKVEEELEEFSEVTIPKNTSKPEQALTEAEFKILNSKETRRKAGSLIRCRVTCMNPNKKGWEGEIISVGSAKLGTFKKYIPFNAEDGWHIPYIIVEAMKERKCSFFNVTTDAKGNKVAKAKQINEFSIEELPSLTKEELKELARRQSMMRGED